MNKTKRIQRFVHGLLEEKKSFYSMLKFKVTQEIYKLVELTATGHMGEWVESFAQTME